MKLNPFLSHCNSKLKQLILSLVSAPSDICFHIFSKIVIFCCRFWLTVEEFKFCPLSSIEETAKQIHKLLFLHLINFVLLLLGQLYRSLHVMFLSI